MLNVPTAGSSLVIFSLGKGNAMDQDEGFPSVEFFPSPEANKAVAFGCFALAAAIGFGIYLFVKNVEGNVYDSINESLRDCKVEEIVKEIDNG